MRRHACIPAVKFVLSAAGHMAGVISAPAASMATGRTTLSPPSPEERLRRRYASSRVVVAALGRMGYGMFDAGRVPAREPGGGKLPVIENAPGSLRPRKIDGREATKLFGLANSLGGTVAAAFSAREPRAVRGLLLLGAPVCFQPSDEPISRCARRHPPDQSEADIIPGSLLSHESAFAVGPDTFVWSRLMDAAMSIDDLRALDVHARVARWALDEAPLPGGGPSDCRMAVSGKPVLS